MTKHTFYAAVRGASFREEEDRNLVETIGQGSIESMQKVRIKLVREPDNPHDPNAIRVHFNDHWVGYVGREWAADIAPLLDSGAIPTTVKIDHWLGPLTPVIEIELEEPVHA